VTISKFAGEDAAFREWLGKKPKGYVLNTHGDYPDRDNTRLHRATCFTLEPGFGGGAAQTGAQIKVVLTRSRGAQRVGDREPRVRAAELALPALRANVPRTRWVTQPVTETRAHAMPLTNNALSVARRRTTA
jgi:hypothetical protein